MAVTIISTPSVSHRQSVSYPFNVVINASNYNVANVTQHRVKAIVKLGAVEIVTKYTIVTDESSKFATFDFSEAFKTQFTLSQLDSTSVDISKLNGTQIRRILDIPEKNITVDFSEQYYLSGVFTTSATVSTNWDCLRGFTAIDVINGRLWNYANWWQVNGSGNFMPFSGKIWQVYPTRTEDDAWATIGAEPWLIVELRKNGAGAAIGAFSLLRTGLGVVYFPIYDSGVTDQDDFLYWEVTIGTGAGTGVIDTSEDVFNIYKNVEDCDGEGETIMFQDRLFQWSFMHFPMKKRNVIQTNGKTGELIPSADKPGRFKYNVESADTMALNTYWMEEEQNDLIKDLIATESAWLVDPGDGSLEQVTIVPNSVRLKTRWTDNLIQYAMSFKKSLDEFKP